MADDASGFLRPFVITGGRTEVRHGDLRLDTVVSARSGRSGAYRDFEHRAVASLCGEPISIAEIAAALDLPVGVITVVVDDLIGDGSLVVHEARSAAVPLSVLERLVQGVRAL